MNQHTIKCPECDWDIVMFVPASLAARAPELLAMLKLYLVANEMGHDTVKLGKNVRELIEEITDDKA